MPKLHIALLAGPALLLPGHVTGAAPLQWNVATVALPDGSVAEIEYLGDIPPRVTIAVPVVQGTRGSADQDAVPAARRVVQARPQAAPAEDQPPELVVRDMPAGSTYEYTLVTTRTDGKVCNQRTEWTSRGRGKEPSVKHFDAGEGCAAAAAIPRAAPVAPPPAPRPVAPAPPPVRIDPDAV